MTFREFANATLDVLESYGYPELILGFNVEDISNSMIGTMEAFYKLNLSPRFCALTIFGMTMHYQVIPAAKNETKH